MCGNSGIRTRDLQRDKLASWANWTMLPLVIQGSLALPVSHGTVRNLLYLNNFLWCGLSVDPHRLLFSFLSEQAPIAQGLYTPASLLVRRIRLDLWCFHQDYHSHYTTLYSHVRTKDSCRIRRMPPPALSLLTILSLHLGSSMRLHITFRCRSITAFSCSVGNTFPCCQLRTKIFLDKILDLI